MTQKIKSTDVVICSGLLMTNDLEVHAVIADSKFPLTIRYGDKIYNVIKSRSGKLRLGNIELEMKTFCGV
jgi:hypothetical protein